ncbi:MAG TPA: VOC family protein [Pedomonas sp.]|uniref:VOC family protein n=1 Tax=Pedomonas sp. TaxID=2976421 RepID=UPI002F412977
MAEVQNGNPSLLSHVSLGTNDFERATRFYDATLKSVGARRVVDEPGAVAYGRAFPEFWVQRPYDGKAAAVGNGTHVAFLAHSRAEVDAFHAAAIAAGGMDEGAPGPRREYSAAYYGCFVRDPDGHKIEAMFWDEAATG